MKLKKTAAAVVAMGKSQGWRARLQPDRFTRVSWRAEMYSLHTAAWNMTKSVI